MELINGQDDMELKCYTVILNHFYDRDNDPIKTEIWKNRALITLMTRWKSGERDILIRNALILILTLFEDLPPDIFNNRGINIKNLSEEDKDRLFSQLKGEFIPN